ncbi:hypothetical protein ACLOJK_036414 [Asimina triloba]
MQSSIDSINEQSLPKGVGEISRQQHGGHVLPSRCGSKVTPPTSHTQQLGSWPQITAGGLNHFHLIIHGRPSQADAQTAPHRSIHSLPISNNIILFKQHLDGIKVQRPIIRWPPPATFD